jgi:hypothetical protein
MSEIIGHFFEAPSGFPCAMREIMAKIMKAQIGNQFPFLFVGLSFEGAEPMVDAIFCQMRTPLRGKDIDGLIGPPTKFTTLSSELSQNTALVVHSYET